MRLSVLKSDIGFREDLHRFRVFFNGVEMFDCHTADEEEGYIRRLIKKKPAPWVPASIKVLPKEFGEVKIVPK